MELKHGPITNCIRRNEVRNRNVDKDEHKGKGNRGKGDTARSQDRKIPSPYSRKDSRGAGSASCTAEGKGFIGESHRFPMKWVRNREENLKEWLRHW